MVATVMSPPESPYLHSHHSPVPGSGSGSGSRNGRSSSTAGYYASTNGNGAHHQQNYTYQPSASTQSVPSQNHNQASHSHSTTSRKRSTHAQQHDKVVTASANQSENTPPPATRERTHERERREKEHANTVSHTRNHSYGQTPSQQFSYKDVYSHPAAIAYMNQHPKRTIPKFGPYLLLQTLGEGEFGKVKLGLHSHWGEEVAVKLIRRAGVDGTIRMSKVEREIEVLKTLRHANIVHLYDVIETDKYIGIIIEYASGGELFDHILAHRFLKEKDACKLFAQLISGVWYIHQKKIVHRDLKLENLLLDRNRNVIITDFGFANRFEHRSDDLMQTSCGSPCYAAPELVISEGLYVGSAVDIWSCGVILYAMLAGYLPFDDDPDNPDGDNINLLYKYIINTPLTFPDHVSDEARDLLSLMLVPDPARRADLRAIMSHSWLQPYRYLFERSVRDLEAVAAESQRQKRLQYQRNLKRSHAAPASSGVTENGERAKHASTAVVEDAMSGSNVVYDSHGRPTRRDALESPGMDVVPKKQKPVSTIVMPSSPMGTGINNSKSSTAAASSDVENMPTSPVRTRKSSQPSATATATARQVVNDTPRSKSSKDSPGSARKRTPGSGSKDKNVPPALQQGTPTPSSNHHILYASPQPVVTATQSGPSPSNNANATDTVRSKRTMRHTIQVEYEDQPTEPIPDTIASPSTPVLLSPNDAALKGVPTYIGIGLDDDPFLSIAQGVPGVRDSALSTGSGAMANAANGVFTLDTLQNQSVPEIEISESMPATPTQATYNAQVQQAAKRTPSPQSPVPSSASQPSSKLSISRSASTQRNGKDVEGRTNGVVNSSNGVPQKISRTETTPIAPAPEKVARKPSNKDKDQPPAHQNGAVAEDGASNASSKKRRYKGLSFTFAKTSTAATEGVHANGHQSRQALASEPPPVIAKTATTASDVDTGSATGPGTSITTGTGTSITDEEKAKDKKDAKSKRRKTLSVMMEPIRRGTMKAVKSRSVNVENGTEKPAERDRKEEMITIIPTPSPSSKISTPAHSNMLPYVQRPTRTPLRVSTNKAQQVMQWFRKGRQAASESDAPELVVPSDVAELSSRSASGTAPSYQDSSPTHSTSTVNRSDVPITITPASPQKNETTQTSNTGPSSWVPRSVSYGLSPSTIARALTPGKSYSYNHDAIRIHHGAVDQGTVTSGAPPEVFQHVTEVLLSMGVEVQKEAEYKYRCIRPKRRKDLSGQVQGLGLSQGASGGVAAFNVTGAATLNGIDQRGLPASSSSTGKLKNLILRRNSSRTSRMGEPIDFAASPDPGTPVAGTTVIEPLYGEKAFDQGDEVRFSVELTRIDRLDQTFSLDIRRLKGNLRSYKFLYDTLRSRCNFSG